MISLMSFLTIWFINIATLVIGVVLWPSLKIRAAGPLFGASFVLSVAAYMAVPLIGLATLALLPLTLWFFNFLTATAVLNLTPVFTEKFRFSSLSGRYSLLFFVSFTNWAVGILSNLSIWF